MTRLLQAALALLALMTLQAAPLAQAPTPDADPHIAGVRIDVTEPERALRFYSEAFGLTEFRRTDHKTFVSHYTGFGRTAAEAEASSRTRLVLFSWPSRDAAGTPRPYAAFSIRVPDVEAAVARVTAAGGTLARPVNRGPSGVVRVALVADPDGNRIELLRIG